MKVYRFVRFRERHGTPVERIPPYFLRYPLNAMNEEMAAWLRAMQQLRGYADWIWTQGAVMELLAVAGNTVPHWQGLLLDGRFTPMDCRAVSQLLKCPLRKAMTLVQRLISAQILEQVQLDGLPEKPPKSPDKPDSDAPIVDDPGLHLSPPLASGCTPLHPRAPGGSGKPRFRGRKEGLPARRGLNRKGTPSAIDSRRENPKTTSWEEKRARALAGLSSDGEIATTVAEQHGDAPTTTPSRSSISSTSPTNPDAPGDLGTDRRRIGPQDVAIPHDADIRLGVDRHRTGTRQACGGQDDHSVGQVGHIVALNLHRYDPAAWEVADRVMEALRIPSPAPGDNQAWLEHHCERSHWAKAWHDVMLEFPSDQQAVILEHVLKIAKRLSSNRDAKDNPEAYLRTVLTNKARDCRRRWPKTVLGEG